MTIVDDAATLAEQLVAPLGRRWDHVQGVGERAREPAAAVTSDDRNLLVAAAWAA
jgi:hypothetical protein